MLAAQAQSPVAEQALETLCRTYWPPIYSFVRREGRSVEDAQDITQGFFARLLERRDFDAARREKGRLRSYLLTALKHFLVNERERVKSLKRGQGQLPISLDELMARERSDPEPMDLLTADRIYDRRWALTVLEQVLNRLGEEYRAANNEGLFDRFKDFLGDNSDAMSQAQIAAELGMKENAVKQAYHRFRCRYRDVLRQEIANTVASPREIDDELRHLVAALRT